ncbi:hypothetical protein AAOGI_24170 [Agarivorans albus]
MSNHLSTVAFTDLVKWSVHFLKTTDLGYKKEFRLYRIGDFLTRNRNTTEIEDEVEYRRVTVKLYSKGVTQRDSLKGKNIGTKRQFLISPGQFIMSKIDARNGAFGIVPDKLDGAIVTADFLSYNIEEKKISPRFLHLLTTTNQFIRFCQNSSSGTTGRQRVKESEFLDIRIPLPDLQTQNRLVDAYDENTRFALDHENKADEMKKSVEQYLYAELGVEYTPRKIMEKNNILQFVQYSEITKWSLNHILKSQMYSFRSCTYGVVSFESVLLRFDGGKTPSKSNIDFWENGSICWTSPKDFKGLYLTDSEDKITDAAINSGGVKLFPKGTILAVFRSGILRRAFPVMLTETETAINQDLKALTVDTSRVETLFFFYYLHLFQKMILEGSSKVGVTVESINTVDFLKLPLVLPPIKKQKEIVENISRMKLEIEENNALAYNLRIQAIDDFEKEIFE